MVWSVALQNGGVVFMTVLFIEEYIGFEFQNLRSYTLIMVNGFGLTS
jgi:hypothetical protein